MKLPKSVDLGLLTESIRHSNQVLRLTMDDRVKIVREVAGLHFSAGGTPYPNICNLLTLYQSVVVRSLISKNPKYDLSSFDESLRRVLSAEQDWMNEHVEKIDLAETMSRVITDAFYPGGGWCKVSLATPCDAASQGWAVDAGQPHVRGIDFEDMILDCAARRVSEMTFIGHWYLCPMEVAKKMYGRFADQLQAASDNDRDFNDQGIERVGRVFRGYFGIKEFEDHVRLAEIYLPRHKLVVTIAEHDVLDKQNNIVPLWVQPWVGPDSGPIINLGFKTIPGAPIPGSPMGDLVDLNTVYNQILRKVTRQAMRMKENTVYQRSDADDVDLWAKAVDGQPIGMRNPDSVKDIIRSGTGIQVLTQVGDIFKQLFMLMGGNLELLGGRRQQTGTAHQEELLQKNAGNSLADLQTETERFMSRVGSNLWWFHHMHPKNVMTSHYQVKGIEGVGVKRKVFPPNPDVLRQHGVNPWKPGDARIRDFSTDAAKVRVVPYSYQHKTPQQRMQFIRSVVGELVPIMPMLQQAGSAFDAPFYTEVLSKYGDEPDIAKLFNATEPPPEEEANETPHDQTLPANTSRTVTRQSIAQDPGVSTQQAASKMIGANPGGAPAFSMNGSK